MTGAAQLIRVGQRVEVDLIRGGGYIYDSSIYTGGRRTTKCGVVRQWIGPPHDRSAVLWVEFDDGDYQTVHLRAFDPTYEGGFPVLAARVV